MSTGKDPKSMPATAEFRDGFDRIYGDRKPQRGRWIVHPATGKLVPAEEYDAPEAEKALHAPVMVDRFMEGSVATDGTDISTRAKRKEYMRRNGLADASDASKKWVQGRRDEREARTVKSTHDTVTELSKVDTRNLRNAVEQLKGKR